MMSAWIKRFFAPPVFQGDTEKTRLATVYNVILWGAAIALLLGLLILNVLDSGEPIGLIDTIIFTLGVVVLAGIFLLHRGYVLHAVVVVLLALYVSFSYVAFIKDGIRDSVVSGYYIVIILASLAMNKRILYVFGALCLFTFMGIYLAEITGLIAGLPGEPSVGDVVVWVVGLTISAILIKYVIDYMSQAHQEAERLVQERSVQLEQEVVERERAREENLRLQQEIIETQQHAIQELSTPIIPLMDRIIVMPLVGSIDSMRARDITRALLAGIREHRVQVVILDITGVSIVDSGVASHLTKTIHAARLKGAQTIVTGISDAVAETIIDLGIDWGDIETLANLQAGLRVALIKMGLDIMPQPEHQARRRVYG